MIARGLLEPPRQLRPRTATKAAAGDAPETVRATAYLTYEAEPTPADYTKIRTPPFFLTDAGRAMAAARRDGILGQVDSLLRRLPVSERERSLQAGELRQAADDWRERSERLLAKHRKTRGRGHTPDTGKP